VTVVVGAVALTCVDALASVGEGLDKLDLLRTFCGPYADGRRVVHVVASRLGHSDPAITLRVYAHVLDDQASQAVTVFERLVQKRAIPESQASVAGTCTVGPWPV